MSEKDLEEFCNNYEHTVIIPGYPEEYEFLSGEIAKDIRKTLSIVTEFEQKNLPKNTEYFSVSFTRLAY